MEMEIEIKQSMQVMHENKLTNTVCRVYLQSDHGNCKFFSLFEKCNNTVIVDIINSVTNVDVQQGDGLPDKICPQFMLELESTINFKRKCENSDAILRDIKVSDNNVIPNLDIKPEKPNEYVGDTCYIIGYEDEKDTHSNYEEFDVKNFNIKPDDQNEYEEDAHEYEEFENKPTLTNDSQAVMIPIQTDRITNSPKYKNTKKPSRAIGLKLECHECGGSFPSKCKLRVHWKKAHKPKLMCSECKRIFKGYKAYHLHKKKPSRLCKIASQSLIEGEGKSRVYHCRQCTFKTKLVRSMDQHQRIHSGEQPFQCDKCSQSFGQRVSLHDHKEKVHKIYKNEYTCQHCGKYFLCRQKFYRHIRIHKNGGECSICQKQFANKEYLLRHMVRHGNIKKFACEYCAGTFYTSHELRNHIRNVHLKIKKYLTCDMCDYKSIRHDIITKHKLMHTETNIPCTVCGIFFNSNKIFKLHEKVHLDRPHSCPNCDATYHTRKLLTNHIRLKHTKKLTKNTKIMQESVNET